jgi:hypothetical protein
MKIEDLFTEDAAGVGIVTDQNTTKDVNKDTLKKMLKAYHLCSTDKKWKTRKGPEQQRSS